MTVSLDVVVLGVSDLTAAKSFYVDGLGGTLEQDYPIFASVRFGDRSPALGLSPRQMAAEDAGVDPVGSGFRAVAFHYLVDSRTAVDETLATAEKAGGTVVRASHEEPWGYCGHFADPDGHLWKVATSASS